MSDLVIVQIFFLGFALVLIWVLYDILATVQKTRVATELTALYTRDLLILTYNAQKFRNGRGELMRWQDPAEDPISAGGILSDVDVRAERKRKREEMYGPDLNYHPCTDFGPEAEAIKEQTAKYEAEP